MKAKPHDFRASAKVLTFGAPKAGPSNDRPDLARTITNLQRLEQLDPGVASTIFDVIDRLLNAPDWEEDPSA